MIVSSALGKYGQFVAASTAFVLIIAYVFANLAQAWLQIPATSLDRLQLFAGVAVGAVFGAQATINGVKGPIDSAHSRLDKIETATGIPTHGVYPNVPGEPEAMPSEIGPASRQ